MERIKSNFVIFSQPRSGSSVLCSNLNYQKDIACMREIIKQRNSLRTGFGIRLGPEERKHFRKLFGDDYIRILLRISYKNFEEYLILLSEISNKPLFGYKIMPKQISFFENKEIYLNYLKNNKSKIILLTRHNSLLTYISLKTARDLGQLFSSSIFAPQQKIIYQLNPIQINYNEYKKYVNQENFNLEERKKDILLYNLPHIHIKYEDLFEGKYLESMAIIYEFLNLDFKRFEDVRQTDGIIAGHKKINVYPIRDKVINYEEFKKAAEDKNDIETLNFLKEGS